MEIRDIIADLIKKYKLTETIICKRSGLHNSQLNRYLNQTNKKDIQVETLLKIIGAFPLEAQSEFWWKMNSISIQKSQNNPVDFSNNSKNVVAERKQ